MNPTFDIAIGSNVRYEDRPYQITHVLDMERVVACDLDSGKQEIVEIKLLKPPSDVQKTRPLPPANTVSDKDWGLVKTKMAAVNEYLALPIKTKANVDAIAAKYGVHTTSIYNWIKRYQGSMTASALLRKQGTRKGRLCKDVEDIVDAVLDQKGLTPQKLKPKALHTTIKKLCRKSDLPVPHINTIRARIRKVSAKVRAEKREGKDAAHAYQALPGTYKEAQFPLQVVQVDHTPLDVIIVDDQYRRPIGRAWLTAAIDVYSRIIVGYWLYIDPPGNHSVGLCLVNSILPKEPHLARFKIKSRCPVWGIPGVVHADNAGEFRGEMLLRSAENNNFDIQWRPVGTPHYGAHIERLCGTLNHSLKEVPGATFSNVDERGDYDSDKYAALSFGELEEWMAVQIYDHYHVEKHSGIETTPLNRFEMGITGTDEFPSRGLPPRIKDEDRLRIEFTPYEKRAVHSYGIEIDKITYFADALRPWINSTDPDNPKEKRKFFVHRDPRDIGVVFFLDPALNIYYDIPYADTSRKRISLWELRAAKKYLESISEPVNEEAIFQAVDRLEQIQINAAEKTKKARRDLQRKKSRDVSLETHPLPVKKQRPLEATESRALTDSSPPRSSTGMSDEIPPAFDQVE